MHTQKRFARSAEIYKEMLWFVTKKYKNTDIQEVGGLVVLRPSGELSTHWRRHHCWWKGGNLERCWKLMSVDR